MHSASFDKLSSLWIIAFGLFGIAFLVTIGVYHFWGDNYRKHIHRSSVSSSSFDGKLGWQKLGTILTYCGLVCYILQTLSIAIQPFELARNDLACDLWEFFATLFYHWSKGCLYALFITRLQIGFDNSALAYSKTKVIYPLYTTIIIYLIAASIADYTDVNSKWNPEIESCEPEWALWGLLLTIFLDLLFSLICLYLFTNPLCKLAEYCKKEKNSENARQFEILVRKYSTLVIIAISSSLIMIFVAASIDSGHEFESTLLQTIIILDNIINVSCMLLLSSIHNKLFGSICKLCLPVKMRQYPEFTRTRVVSSNAKMTSTDLTHNNNNNNKNKNNKIKNSKNTIEEERNGISVVNIARLQSISNYVSADSGYNSENDIISGIDSGNNGNSTLVSPQPDHDGDPSQTL